MQKEPLQPHEVAYDIRLRKIGAPKPEKASSVTYLHMLRRFSRNARLCLISAAVVSLVFGGIYAVLLNLYLLRLGHGPAFVGLVNGAGGLAFAVFSLPGGLLGSRIGARAVMLWSLLLAVVGFGILPFAEFMPHQKTFLVVSYALGSLGLFIYVINSHPFLIGTTKPEERSYALSLQAAFWPIFGFIGSLLGGFLPGVFAHLLHYPPNHPAVYRYPLLFASLLLLPALGVVSATREDNRVRQPRTGRAPWPLMAAMGLTILLQLAAEYTMRTFFNVYMDARLGVSTAMIGSVTGIAQLMAGAASLATPMCRNRLGMERVIIWGGLGMAASMLPMIFIPRWWAASLSLLCITAITAMRRPSSIEFHQSLVPVMWRATMAGAMGMFGGLGAMTVSTGGGYVIAAFGYRSLFVTATMLTALGSLVFWAYFRTPRWEYARAK